MLVFSTEIHVREYNFSKIMTIFAEDKLHLSNLKQASLHSVCTIFAEDINLTTILL